MSAASFPQVIGQDRVKKVFVQSLTKARLAHAYLFFGPSGVGKSAMAIAMGMGLNCSHNVFGGCGTCPSCIRILRLEHPAFHLILPVPSRPKSMKEEKYLEIIRERKLALMENPYRAISFAPELSGLPAIGIDEIRGIKGETRLVLSESGCRVFVICQADRMTVPAMNSLLKLLEEPPENTVFFLTTEVPNQILPTIVSRCQKVPFDMIPENEMIQALTQRWGISPEKAQFFAKISGGSLSQALRLSDTAFEKKRENALGLLEALVESDIHKQLDGLEKFWKEFEKSELQHVLDILAVLFRDMYFFRLGFPERIIEADWVEILQKLHERYPRLDPEQGMRNVFRAIDLMQKNVYLPLVIFSLTEKLIR